MPKRLKSGICKQSQIESPEFLAWASRFPPVRPEVPRDHPHLDRKLWEWCFICQALWERGLLAPGRKGLGFAVGQEPLPSLFAAYGCEVVATDQSPEAAAQSGGNWVQTGQHAASLDVLYKAGHCPAELFRQRVRFREVDMTAIPADLCRR